MKRSPDLLIENVATDFASIWIHFQDVDSSSSSCANYHIRVPDECISAIFDPHETREMGCSWPDFIKNQIEELGTFILEGYVDNIKKMISSVTNKFEWVIATVDDVSRVDGNIVISGSAVKFRPREN